MGLTIHYQLRSNATCPEEARKQVEQLRQAALDLAMSEVGEVLEFTGIACNSETSEDNSRRWLLIQSRRMIRIGREHHFVVPIHLFAFSTWPGEGCEAANLGLALYPDTIESEEGRLATNLKGWSWQSFCKTQYATNPDVGMARFVRCHVTVIRLLDHAKEMGILEAVTDEGQFWKNRDIETLVETAEQWDRRIARVVGQFKDQTLADIVAPISEYSNF